MSETKDLGLQRRWGLSRRLGPSRPGPSAGSGRCGAKGKDEGLGGNETSKKANNVLEYISKIVGFCWLCLKLLGFFVAQK
jgi:hypothetical protein